MSTKKESKSTNQYNPASMNAFNTLTPQAQKTYSDYMQDPLQSQWFALQLAKANEFSQGLAQTGQANIFNNLPFGGGNTPGYLQAASERNNRSLQHNLSSNFINQLIAGNQLRLQTAGNALQYKPLQIGQTNVEKTSGVGTWLPQLAGAAIQGASAFATGGASMAGQMGTKAASGAGGMFAGVSSNPFFTPNYGYDLPRVGF